MDTSTDGADNYSDTKFLDSKEDEVIGSVTVEVPQNQDEALMPGDGSDDRSVSGVSDAKQNELIPAGGLDDSELFEASDTKEKESMSANGSCDRIAAEVTELKQQELTTTSALCPSIGIEVCACVGMEVDVAVKPMSYEKNEVIPSDGSGDHIVLNISELNEQNRTEVVASAIEVNVCESEELTAAVACGSIDGEIEKDGLTTLANSSDQLAADIPKQNDQTKASVSDEDVNVEASGSKQKAVAPSLESTDEADAKAKRAKKKDLKEASGSGRKVVTKVSNSIKKDLKKRLGLVVKKVIAIQRLTAEKTRFLFAKN